MVRFVALVTAFVTLGVAAGTPVPSTKAEVDADQGLHERRTSSDHEGSVYCYSYTCPRGCKPLGGKIKCINYKCTKAQCCETADYVYCDSYDCPHGYDHVYDADDTKCKDYKCTKDQCCDKDYDYCDSYYCPKHYSLKDDADDIKCSYSGCTTSKCCDYN